MAKLPYWLGNQLSPEGIHGWLGCGASGIFMGSFFFAAGLRAVVRFLAAGRRRATLRAALRRVTFFLAGRALRFFAAFRATLCPPLIE